MRKFILLFTSILIVISCSNEDLVVDEALSTKDALLIKEGVQETVITSKSGTKVSICHKNAGEIAIDSAALAMHMGHGDAVDMDGDGFYTENDNTCSETDCDDTRYSLENICLEPYYAEGGVVFYYFKSGEEGYVEGETHGLVADLSNLSNSQWGCMCIPVVGTSSEIGAGQANTTTIVNNSCHQDDGITSAAEACDNYDVTVDGTFYDDWYLPSKEELNLIYLNKSGINIIVSDKGGNVLSDTRYWSSTESSYSTCYAWFQDFSDGFKNIYYKETTYSVRAVRAF